MVPVNVGGPGQGVSPPRNWRTTPSRDTSHQVGSLDSGKTSRTSNPTRRYHSSVWATSVAFKIAETASDTDPGYPCVQSVRLGRPTADLLAALLHVGLDELLRVLLEDGVDLVEELV